MSIEIVEYGFALNVASRVGIVRLKGSDGKLWQSPPLAAMDLCAFAAVLGSGASVSNGWLHSTSKGDLHRFDLAATAGESPFPW